jgi:MinD superfamily P-loop ATPase
MHDANEVSRRDFLKFIPRYLAYSVHTFTEELSRLTDIQAQTETIEAANENCEKIAEIDTNCCMAWDGGSCQFCYLACPLRDKAMTIEDQKPIIHSTICDGCAKCLTACKTVNTNLAIKMVAVN